MLPQGYRYLFYDLQTAAGQQRTSRTQSLCLKQKWRTQELHINHSSPSPLSLHNTLCFFITVWLLHPPTMFCLPLFSHFFLSPCTFLPSFRTSLCLSSFMSSSHPHLLVLSISLLLSRGLFSSILSFFPFLCFIQPSYTNTPPLSSNPEMFSVFFSLSTSCAYLSPSLPTSRCPLASLPKHTQTHTRTHSTLLIKLVIMSPCSLPGGQCYWLHYANVNQPKAILLMGYDTHTHTHTVFVGRTCWPRKISCCFR